MTDPSMGFSSGFNTEWNSTPAIPSPRSTIEADQFFFITCLFAFFGFERNFFFMS